MKVKWDDYSQYMEKYNMFQTTYQIDIYIYLYIYIYSGKAAMLSWSTTIYVMIMVTETVDLLYPAINSYNYKILIFHGYVGQMTRE